MQKILFSFFLTLFLLSSLIGTAEAKRFGGGKSFGVNRSASNHAARTNAAPANKPATGHKWMGALAGLAAGGLLASLFMGHGLGSGILSWVMILAGAFLIWRLLSRFRFNNLTNKNNSHAAFQTEPAAPAFNQGRTFDATPAFSSAATNTHSFDEAAFLRTAKTIFIRLQAAYDHKNLADIREFTAPEVFAEIQMQLQERGHAENITEVLQIDASLLDLDIASDALTASVQFAGQIKEEGTLSNIKEVWHFCKSKNNEAWTVAGIQQN